MSEALSSTPEAVVLLDIRDHVATITLNQPDRRNPMTPELLAALPGVIETVAADASVRAVVITGAGKSFSAGADFRTLAGLIQDSGIEGIAGVHAGIEKLYAAFLPIADLEVPTIAAVNGAAVGGGLGIALLCDIRIVGDDAKIGANFSRLGIHPGLGITGRLPRLIGHEAAAEMLFTGRLIRGKEAAEIGLARRSVPNAEVLSTAQALAQEIAGAAPLAIRAIKKTLRTSATDDLGAVIRAEAMAQAILSQSADASEGIQAQMARREPKFRGQ